MGFLDSAGQSSAFGPANSKVAANNLAFTDRRGFEASHQSAYSESKKSFRGAAKRGLRSAPCSAARNLAAAALRSFGQTKPTRQLLTKGNEHLPLLSPAVRRLLSTHRRRSPIQGGSMTALRPKP